MISIEQAQKEVLSLGNMTWDYKDRMVTNIPNADVITRNVFILKQCLDKTILDVGCYGPLHKDIREVAKRAYGIDIRKMPDDPDFMQLELTKDPLPVFSDVELVICGEVIEHLSNPGMFLGELKEKYPTVNKIFTVPNAFGSTQVHWIKKLKENTNRDHVAYYSYVTFSELLRRYDYRILEFYWYDNPEQVQQHGFNEGMVFVTT